VSWLFAIGRWLLGLLLGKTDQQRAVETARELGQAESNKGVIENVEKANAAADRVRAADPASLRDDDGFQRHD